MGVEAQVWQPEVGRDHARGLANLDRFHCGIAVHVREVVMQVFQWAIEHGQKVQNPSGSEESDGEQNLDHILCHNERGRHEINNFTKFKKILPLHGLQDIHHLPCELLFVMKTYILHSYI